MSASLTGSCYRLSRASQHPFNMNGLNNSSVLVRTDASTGSQIKEAPRRNAWGFFISRFTQSSISNLTTTMNLAFNLCLSWKCLQSRVHLNVR